MPSEYEEYAIKMDRLARYGKPPKGSKCKECGSTKNLKAINTYGDYVCLECWDKYGYEYDPTPW